MLSSSRRVTLFQALIHGALPLIDVGLATLQVWYGVPAHASEALEEAMADALPHLFDTAPNLIYQLVRSCLSNHSASTDGRRTRSTVYSLVNS